MTRGTFVPAEYVERYGLAAVMLAQLDWLYNEAKHVAWTERDGHQWLIYPDHEWEGAVGLGVDQARRARRKLEDAGEIVTVTHRVKGVPTTFLRRVPKPAAESPVAYGEIAESPTAKSPNLPLYETGKTTEGDASALADDDEWLLLCHRLADHIEGNGSKRPTVSKAWLTAARLLVEKDGRTVGQVERMIDWCQGDEFWRANILSMPKLREKYDQMRLQANRAPSRPRESDRQRKQRRALEEMQRHAANRQELPA